MFLEIDYGCPACGSCNLEQLSDGEHYSDCVARLYCIRCGTIFKIRHLDIYEVEKYEKTYTCKRNNEKRTVIIIKKWSGKGPRNVLVQDVLTKEAWVRPFRGMRKTR